MPATERRKHIIRPSSPPGRDKSDVFLPGLLAFLAVILFSGLLVQAGLWGWLKSLKRPMAPARSIRGHISETGAASTAKDVPILQLSPEKDWRSYRVDQEKLLNSYGWVDQTAGVIRIPIQESINRIAEHGLPHWGGTNIAVSPLELQRGRATKEGGAHP